MAKIVLISILSVASLFVPAESIAGGTDATPGDYPYFVEFGGCGGSLIAPDVVLTAAQCINPAGMRGVQANIGAYEFAKSARSSQSRFYDECVVGPDLDAGGFPGFALCKLDEPVFINEAKVRLELNEDASVPEDGEELIAIGMGLANRAYSPPYGCIKNPNYYRQRAQYLQEAPLLAGCYDTTFPVPYNVTTVLCSDRPFEGGKEGEDFQDFLKQRLLVERPGACDTDMGGPLVQIKEMGDGTVVHTHVGITSFDGLGGFCGYQGWGDYFARTSSGIDWIKETTCQSLASIADFCDNPSPPPPPACDGPELKIILAMDDDVTRRGVGQRMTLSLVEDGGPPAPLNQYVFTLADEVNVHTICLEHEQNYVWSIIGSHELNRTDVCQCGEDATQLPVMPTPPGMTPPPEDCPPVDLDVCDPCADKPSCGNMCGEDGFCGSWKLILDGDVIEDAIGESEQFELIASFPGNTEDREFYPSWRLIYSKSVSFETPPVSSGGGGGTSAPKSAKKKGKGAKKTKS